MSNDHDHHHEHHHTHGPNCGHSHDVVYSKVVKASHKVASVLLRNAKTIELTFDQRQEVPHDCTATDSSHLICHIEESVEIGDKLVSNTNEWAIVAAATEDLFEIPREQTGYEAFLHIAGINFWPVELTDNGARVVASHECLHMLEHYALQYSTLSAPMHELTVPEIKHHECCDHDHDHGHHHGHQHGPDCGHDH